MRNVNLPNPSTPADQFAILQQALNAIRQAQPAVTVAALVTGSTTYTYVVVARSSGWTIPSAATSITNGASSLSSSNSNTVSWGAVPLYDVVYDVYRTVGGASQGLIASGLSGVTSLVDVGQAGDSSTPPSFNDSGLLAAGTIPKIQVFSAAGAITLLSGEIAIGGSAATALTLAAPIAGTPESGGQDGAKLHIFCTTAHAHTVTTPANKINGADHVITFAAVGDFMDLTAVNGVWQTGGGNGTLS